jgi:DNA transformation protein
MGSSQATADYICEQAAGAGTVSTRKMFGEYAVYVGGRVAALICGDQLFVKPTPSGIVLLERATGGTPRTGSPYPGAKPHLIVAGDLWDDMDFMAGLLRETARELPEPRPKKPKR